MFALVLLITSLAWTPASAQFDESEELKAWLAKQEDSRAAIDQLVVCFDEGSFLAELARWDDRAYWPILLWDSDLVPKFIREYDPEHVLLAPPSGKGADIETALMALSDSWGIPEVARAQGPDEFLEVLKKRKRTPNGCVLVADGSPELLGGMALAAGRFQLPLDFDTPEPQTKSIHQNDVERLRLRLIEELTRLEVVFDARFDELDFVTVASDLPFGYTQDDINVHPGGYTVDDRIARNDDLTRWAWVGRLMGGPVRSVYMAMGALFLQPKKGLLWSRYNPKNASFGVFDPQSSVAEFEKLFPTEAIRHPDATLAKWREHQWPSGNRYGFLYVNSSGGAKNWSTSKGQASYFDVPDTVPSVVHYTHSGSAARPFDVESIAGRWMANGSYVYFGSYAEPYLNAFVPPSSLASRVTVGLPLGAAMRHPYRTNMAGQRKMKVKGTERVVSFNMTGPWKLAYFGDPMYRLTGKPVAKTKIDKIDGYLTPENFLKLKGKSRGDLVRYVSAAVAIDLVDTKSKAKLDERRAAKLFKSAKGKEAQSVILGEIMQAWIETLRTIDPKKRYQPKVARKLLDVPRLLKSLLSIGTTSDDGSRLTTEFTKSYISGLLAAGGDKKVGGLALELVCTLPHSKGSQKDVYKWVVEAAGQLGIKPAELQKAVLKHKWLHAEVRAAVSQNIK